MTTRIVVLGGGYTGLAAAKLAANAAIPEARTADVRRKLRREVPPSLSWSPFGFGSGIM